MSVDVSGLSKDETRSDASSEEDGETCKKGPPRRFGGDYLRGRELGSGASGKVYICSKQDYSVALAVKAIDLRRVALSPNAQRERKKLSREVEILKGLPSHPNIVQFVDAFEEGCWMFIVLELVGGGDLFTALTSRKPPRFLEREAAFVMKQLSIGISFLHQKGIIHRDVKLENVLVASERRDGRVVLYNVKLTDFGLSKAVGAENSAAISAVGTRPYAAPEVMSSESLGAYDFKSDLWSLGVLLCVMLLGRFPFQQIPQTQAEMSTIVEKKISASRAAKSFTRGLLMLDPMSRPSLISSHEWLSEVFGNDSVERQAKRSRLDATQSRPAPPEQSDDADNEEPAGPSFATSMPPPAVSKHVEQAPQLANWICPTLQDMSASSVLGTWLEALYASSRIRVESAQTPFGDLQKIYPRRPRLGIWQVYILVCSSQKEKLHPKSNVHLKQIATTLGCEIRMASESSLSGNLISVVGTYNQCVIVQEVLHGRASELKPCVETLLLLRAEAAGVVIGKQGCMLSQICQRSGARVQLLKDELEGHWPCIITGELQRTLHAQRHIFHLTRAIPLAAPVATEVVQGSPPFSPFPPTPAPSPLGSP